MGNSKPNPTEEVALYSTNNILEEVSLLIFLLFKKKKISLMTQPRASGGTFPLLIYLDRYTYLVSHLSTHPEAFNGS